MSQKTTWLTEFSPLACYYTGCYLEAEKKQTTTSFFQSTESNWKYRPYIGERKYSKQEMAEGLVYPVLSWLWFLFRAMSQLRSVSMEFCLHWQGKFSIICLLNPKKHLETPGTLPETPGSTKAPHTDLKHCINSNSSQHIVPGVLFSGTVPIPSRIQNFSECLGEGRVPSQPVHQKAQKEKGMVK